MQLNFYLNFNNQVPTYERVTDIKITFKNQMIR